MAAAMPLMGTAQGQQHDRHASCASSCTELQCRCSPSKQTCACATPYLPPFLSACKSLFCAQTHPPTHLQSPCQHRQRGCQHVPQAGGVQGVKLLQLMHLIQAELAQPVLACQQLRKVLQDKGGCCIDSTHPYPNMRQPIMTTTVVAAVGAAGAVELCRSARARAPPVGCCEGCAVSAGAQGAIELLMML